jgi:hypothetical protein
MRCSRCTSCPRWGFIDPGLTALERSDLLAFLKSIDGTTARFPRRTSLEMP